MNDMTTAFLPLARLFIDDIENRFGATSSSSWVLTHILVDPDGTNPHIRYYPPSTDFAIVLTPKVLGDELQTIFQLAHECVHTLSPNGDGSGALVLEEGLATWYSLLQISIFLEITETQHSDVRYAKACLLLMDLLAKHPDAIKKLRSIEPDLKKLTLDTFLSAGMTDLDEESIAALLTPFTSFTP